MTSRFEIYKAYHKAVKDAEEAQKAENEKKNGKVACVKEQKVVQPSKDLGK